MENTAVDKSALGTPPEAQSRAEKIVEFKRQKTLLKAGALQDAIFNSARFSSIATDEKGVIQIFNVGAERMLGYAAADAARVVRIYRGALDRLERGEADWFHRSDLDALEKCSGAGLFEGAASHGVMPFRAALEDEDDS